MSEINLAVIGGSGVYHMEALTDVEERHVVTPFGAPSDAIHIGTLSGRRIAFLARHGRGHPVVRPDLRRPDCQHPLGQDRHDGIDRLHAEHAGHVAARS